MKNLYKIDIFTSNGDIYFRTENRYFEDMNECLDYYEKKYLDCNFEIKEYFVVL